MNASPPTSAPAMPRSDQAEKMQSCVDAGPGSRLQAAIASSKRLAAIHPRRSTTSSRSMAMWAGGPPKPSTPILPHSRATVSSDGGCGDWSGAAKDEDSAAWRRSYLSDGRRAAF